jgi:hypothetical protein
MGPSGTIQGQWVLIGGMTTLTSQSFDLTLGGVAPIKIFWHATSVPSNDTCLVMKLTGDTTGVTALWKEVNFISSESRGGTEMCFISPTEAFTLTLSAKRGGIASIAADIYEFTPSG